MRACGFELAAFLGLILIPVAGYFDAWNLAVEEAADFLRLLLLASPRGASDRRGNRQRSYLILLAPPILWALLFTCLARRPSAQFPLERLTKRCSVTRVFAVLERLADLPPSVSFAAGVLASVAAPPTAARWIEQGRRQAEQHGARGFAAYFTRLVTEC